MSRSVSMQRCIVSELYEELVRAFGVFASLEQFEEIISVFGEIHAGVFFIIDNEYNETYNSFQNLFSYLNRVYHLEDSFSVGLSVFQDGVTHVSLGDAFKKLDPSKSNKGN